VILSPPGFFPGVFISPQIKNPLFTKKILDKKSPPINGGQCR